MRPIELLKASFATLLMNLRRTFLTMIGIIIGIAAVITILSIGAGFQQKTLNSLAKDAQGRRSQEFFFNVTQYQGDFTQLTAFSDKNIAYIEDLPGVDEASLMGSDVKQEYMNIKLHNQQNYHMVGLEDASHERILAGRNLHSGDSKAKLAYTIISEQVAREYFGSIEEALNRALSFDGNAYTVVGVYQQELPMENPLVMMEEPAQAIIPMGTYQRYILGGGYNYGMTVYFTDEADMKQLSRNIADYLKEEGSGKNNGTYEYFDRTEMMDQIGQQLRMITYFIAAIAGISLFIAGVGVMNMMYISVSERTKEIGIRRALGATKGSIQGQFLLEGIVITSFGGVLGYLFGLLCASVISRFLPFAAVFEVQTALASVLISVIIGVIFSVFPARQAAQKNVVEILR
ncbi:ABC transporter permease [Suicoccus acidiformans]|uniref:ABC transporter permease n=1 Tax=Suicoccus acidiformans TaxID=2036206 RepID=A0A347WKM1_9LACT|nr:ABC transporter permease [Suicoccus acidiformans]AXY25628.1 ABC transporter permease [Suicoccus acidiformans]